jgi:hypothetical protein
MEREPLPLKKVILTGVLNGLFFALFMAGYYHFFTDDPFSLLMFVFHFTFFGFFMALSFRYKYNKKKEN